MDTNMEKLVFVIFIFIQSCSQEPLNMEKALIEVDGAFCDTANKEPYSGPIFLCGLH